MVLVAGACVLISLPFLFFGSNSELAPTEDQGVVLVSGTGPATATLKYLNKYDEQIHKFLSSFPETALVWQISGLAPSGGAGNSAIFGGGSLKLWADRSRTEMQILPQVQKKLDAVTGLQTVAFTLPVVPDYRAACRFSSCLLQHMILYR